MISKKILIVGNSFYPENSPRAFRTTELAKEFSRQGHEVTVIVPKNIKIHSQFEKEYRLTIKDLGTRNYNELDSSKGNKITKLVKRAINRSKDLFFHYPDILWMFLVKKALKNENGYDLLITIAYPHPIHWGAAWVRTKNNRIAKTWIADCGDPFMGSTTDTFKRLFYFKNIEKYWNKKCDFITVPFEGAIAAYYKEFHDKIKVIPQGFDFNEVKVDKKKYTPNAIPTFGYAGGFIPGARDPKPFVDYLLEKKKPFKFIVYTQSLNMIQPLLEKANSQIEVRDYIPRTELIKKLSKMDFILNLNNGVSTQLPSKLIDYYLTWRPVLSLDSHDLDTKIMDEFLESNYQGRYQYNNPDQYRIENICKAFLNLIN